MNDLKRDKNFPAHTKSEFIKRIKIIPRRLFCDAGQFVAKRSEKGHNLDTSKSRFKLPNEGRLNEFA